MKRKLFVFIIILIIIPLMISGCNMKDKDFDKYFPDIIKHTTAINYHTKFVLTEYILKEDSIGVTGNAKYRTEKITYEIAHLDNYHYEKIIKGDSVVEKWIDLRDTTPIIVIKNNDELIATDCSTSENINLIFDLLNKYSKLDDMDILYRQGVKHAKFTIYKIKTETVIPIDSHQPYRKKVGKKDSDGYKYFWDNIQSAVKDTINITIKNNKIDMIEAIIECAEARKKPAGQIAITDSHVGVVTKRVQLEAKMSYDNIVIPPAE